MFGQLAMDDIDEASSPGLIKCQEITPSQSFHISYGDSEGKRIYCGNDFQQSSETPQKGTRSIQLKG